MEIYNKNIGIICHNNEEWIECQKNLFNLDFEWSSSGKKILSSNSVNLEYYKQIIILVYCESKKLTYSSFKNYNINKVEINLYDATIFLRKHKLEKLYELKK